MTTVSDTSASTAESARAIAVSVVSRTTETTIALLLASDESGVLRTVLELCSSFSKLDVLAQCQPLSQYITAVCASISADKKLSDSKQDSTDKLVTLILREESWSRFPALLPALLNHATPAADDALPRLFARMIETNCVPNRSFDPHFVDTAYAVCGVIQRMTQDAKVTLVFAV